MGILVTDPELSTTPTGIAMATFTAAANDDRYDPEIGQWTDHEATRGEHHRRRHALHL